MYKKKAELMDLRWRLRSLGPTKPIRLGGPGVSLCGWLGRAMQKPMEGERGKYGVLLYEVINLVN